MHNRQQATNCLHPSGGDIRDTAASQKGLRHNSNTRCCELTLMHETSPRRRQDCRRHASAHQMTSHSADLQICNFECGSDINLGTHVRGSCSNTHSILNLLRHLPPLSRCSCTCDTEGTGLQINGCTCHAAICQRTAVRDLSGLLCKIQVQMAPPPELDRHNERQTNFRRWSRQHNTARSRQSWLLCKHW